MGWAKGNGQKVYRLGQQTPPSAKNKKLARNKEENSGTALSDKAIILADLWLNYRDEEAFIDFVEYNDLGLPLAYAIANGIVEASQTATEFVDETFRLLLAGLEVEDTGFESLDEIIDASPN